VERKVYDYKTARTLAPAIFMLIWGTPFLIGGVYGFLNGPLKDSSGGVWSSLSGIPFALLGLIADLGGCLSILRAVKEKVVIQDGNMTYCDWRGRQRVRCQLSDCRLGEKYYMWQPWLGIGPGQRSGQMAYKIATPDGSFSFTETIRGEDELVQLLAEAGNGRMRGR
jgi:hypothetical protein